MTTDLETRATKLRHAMADHLRESGAITSDAWHQAFRDVARHVFVPQFIRNQVTADGELETTVYSATENAEEWLTQVYSDTALVTDAEVRSSSTAPSLMARMLETLDVHPDHRVLEIGAGTGYNAALLCHRLGDTHVTTIDIDHTTADQARKHLAAVGYRPTVAPADGLTGYPDNGPYHRIIATSAPDPIPMAWLAQTLPAGRIVTPFRSGVLALTVHDRHHAAGHFTDYAAFFMRLRTGEQPDLAEVIRAAQTAEGIERLWTVDPAQAITDMNFRLYLDLAMPDVTYDRGLSVAYHPSGAWARFAIGHVVEGGPWQLWQAVESHHAAWLQLGSPARRRFGVGINRRLQHAWLDETSSQQVWDLSSPHY